MDQIVRVIAKDAPVKAMAISARDTVERARAIHDCWPVAAAALGRLLMAASMMGAVMKGEDGGRWAPSPPCRTITAMCGAMCRNPPWTCPGRPRASWMWGPPWAVTGS